MAKVPMLLHKTGHIACSTKETISLLPRPRQHSPSFEKLCLYTPINHSSEPPLRPRRLCGPRRTQTS